MQIYRVMACSKEEYDKANRIPGYVPQEYEVALIEAQTEHQAKLLLKKGISKGKYPGGSQLA